MSVLALAPVTSTLGAIGDSHVNGDSFVAKAARRLGWPLVGDGVPGAMVESVAPQLEAVASADVVVLSAGTNNLGSAAWQGIDNLCQHYPALLKELAGKRVICTTIIPFQNGWEDHVVDAMNWIIRREAERHGAEVFDAHRFLMGQDGKVRSVLDYRDMLHLSERGNEYLGSLLAYQIANP